jgi:hypothetical protein
LPVAPTTTTRMRPHYPRRRQANPHTPPPRCSRESQ